MKDVRQAHEADRPPSLTRARDDGTATGRASAPLTVNGPEAGGDSVPITVNGQQYLVSPPELTREELVALLYPHFAPDGRAAMTVSFHRGPASAPSGFLHARERVKVVPQQTFNVALTVRS